MGLKTLQAQAAEAKKEVATTIGVFVKEARAINAMVAQYEKKIVEITKAQEEMSNLVVKSATAAKSLNTHGIVQLDSMKRLLIVATENSYKPHAVNLAEIEKLEQTALSEIEQSLRMALTARMEKIVASWPNKIEVGMIFRNGDRLLEISGPQTKASNVNLKGDAALWHKVKLIKDGNYTGESQINLEELSPKKGWKFLKT
jgi:predicted lipase